MRNNVINNTTFEYKASECIRMSKDFVYTELVSASVYSETSSKGAQQKHNFSIKLKQHKYKVILL